MSLRLVNAGTVSPLRSQALYHGLAYARTEATPDTIVLCSPGEPYVCVGFHQDIHHEVDLAFCRQRGFPVLRRETGGGTVYLDGNQLFVQWIMGPDSLPLRTEQRFRLFAEPLVATYRELGIAAHFRAVNDVHVDDRKIVGTGAGRIGDAEVLVGNFIFDFDTDVMTRVLNAPSTPFRDQVRRSLERYMTSVRREIGSMPDLDTIATLYRRKCEETLGTDIHPGALSDTEVAAIEEVEAKLASDSFRLARGGLRRPGVKIHQDIHVIETTHERNGSPIRVTARLRNDRIEDVAVTGTSRHTSSELEHLRERLVGSVWDQAVEELNHPPTRARHD